MNLDYRLTPTKYGFALHLHLKKTSGKKIGSQKEGRMDFVFLIFVIESHGICQNRISKTTLTLFDVVLALM